MKKFFLTVVVGVIALMMFAINSYAADEWTDFSKAGVEVTKKEDGVFYLKITGVTFKKESAYKLFIKSGDVQFDFSKDNDNIIINSENNGSSFASSKLVEVYELNKDVYAYIIEQKDGKYASTPYKAKLPRVNQNILGKRITGSFFGTSTIIHFNEPSKDLYKRNVKIKIGTISDTNILKQIKNGETSSLNNLLTYAKKASAIFETKIGVQEKKAIISKNKLIEGAYYYIYILADDENGKYYPVEDVSLYQYKYYPDNEGQLIDYLDNRFKWNIENGTPSTSTPDTDTKKTTSGTNNPTKTPDKTLASGKIPKAGVGFGLITLMIITVGGLIFAYYKCNRLKGI